MCKTPYDARIAATLLLIDGAVVHLLRPVGTSRPLPLAGVNDVYALEAQIDIAALPRSDLPSEDDQ
jgi:hypothetical protein